MRFRRAAATVAALTLSLPGAAFAQSAGDDQYRDPFGEEGQPQDQSGGGSAQTAPDTSGQTAPNPTPAPAPAPTPAPSTGTEPTATVAGELPRTGLGAGLMTALGVVLLGAGIGLRRGTEPF